MANSDLELKKACFYKRSQSRKLFSKSNYSLYEFVITPGYLKYYSILGGSRGKEKARVQIACIKYVEKVTENDLEGKPYVLQLAYVEDIFSTNRFILYVVASSAGDRDEWITAIRQQCRERGASFYPRYHPGVWQKPGRFSCCDAIHRRSCGCQDTTPLQITVNNNVPSNELIISMDQSSAAVGNRSVATLLSQDMAVINLHAASDSPSNIGGPSVNNKISNSNSKPIHRGSRDGDLVTSSLPHPATLPTHTNGGQRLPTEMDCPTPDVLQRQCSEVQVKSQHGALRSKNEMGVSLSNNMITREPSGAKQPERTRNFAASPLLDGGNMTEENDVTNVGNIVIAIHSYNPLRCNQLALQKGEKYIVIDSSNPQWWYVRNASGSTGYVPTSFVHKPDGLTTFDWYYKDLTRQQAEAILLEENREGCFLVRDSVSRRDTYTLSVTSKDPENPCKLKVHHYHIHCGEPPNGVTEPANGAKPGSNVPKSNSKTGYHSMYYLSEKHAFPTIKDVIHYHKHNSGGLVVRLRSPPVRDKDTPATAGMGLDEFEVDPAELICEPELIGKGQFGVVKKGTFHGLPVAIKQMLDGAMNEEDFIEEAKNMKSLNHPNLVQLFGVVLRSRPIMIITEYMEYGSLRDFLRRNHATLAPRAVYLSDVCAQVAAGMAYLEKQQFVHRDLAARNCLVRSVHGSSSVCVKVADFGMTRFLLDNVYEPSAGTKFPVRWASPEVFQSLFTSKADVWSFAVLMWEVFTCCLESPYHGKDNAQVYQYIIGGGRLSKPAVCPERLYVLMLECWQHDPNKRPTFQYICQKLHAFLDLHAENS